jgi:quinoprotein glucose dehydrogenase
MKKILALSIITIVLLLFVVVSKHTLSSLKQYVWAVAEQLGVDSLVASIVYDVSPNPYQFDFEAPIESRSYRESLPLYRIVKGMSLENIEPSAHPDAAEQNQFQTWHRSHGDVYSSKYSKLTSITPRNTDDLDVAWAVDTASSGAWEINVETNPIVVNGSLYVPTPQNELISIDARSGKIKWSTSFSSVPARRGLVWWPGEMGTSGQLFVPTSAGDLVALAADSGRPIGEFGNDGVIHPGASTSAPIVHNGQLIVAVNSPPKVESYDVLSGRRRWSTSLIQGSRKVGGGAPWSGMSLDPSRRLLFVTTGNPKPAFYGGQRLGSNKYSNSVIAIDVGSGEIVWSWQEVAHGLWDYDIPSPPILTTINRSGKKIDVVLVLTKIGNVIVLERASGNPVYDYRYRRAPTSLVPGEQTEPYQPDLEIPEPISSTAFSVEDITDIGEKNRRSITNQLVNTIYGFFQPPVLGRTLISFGLHGGAEWPGGAVDHEKGILFMAINHIPWKLRLSLVPTEQIEVEENNGQIVYREYCESCHKRNRAGEFLKSGEKELKYVPSLVGASRIDAYIKGLDISNWQKTHSKISKNSGVDQNVLHQILKYFRLLDDQLIKKKAISAVDIWSQFLDYEDYPGSKPPWGEVVAIDLNQGALLWRVPFGEYQQLTERGLPITGQENFGGLIVTKPGLVIATGTPDSKIRIFDAANGEELWSYMLPAAGSAPPITYEIDGIQYISVVATGGQYHSFQEKASSIVTFRLPD